MKRSLIVMLLYLVIYLNFIFVPILFIDFVIQIYAHVACCSNYKQLNCRPFNPTLEKVYYYALTKKDNALTTKFQGSK
jgi:hypothetical protein